MSTRSRALSAVLTLALVGGLGLGTAAPVGAVTCTGTARAWNGPATNADWNDGNNWLPTGAPASNDLLVVPGSVSFSSPVMGSVCSLELRSAASFSAALDLDVTGDLTFGSTSAAGSWNITSSAPAGTTRRLVVHGTTKLVSSSGLTLTLNAVGLDVRGPLDLNGESLVLNGAATTRLGAGSQIGTAAADGNLTVKNGAHLAVDGSVPMSSPTVLLLQDGSVVESAAGSLTGTGVVDWQGGALTGTLGLAVRTVVDGSGTRSIPSGSRVTLDQPFTVTTGSVALDGTLVNRTTLRGYAGTSLQSPSGNGVLSNEVSGILAVGSSDLVPGSGDVKLTDLSVANAGLVSVVSGTRLLLGGTRVTPATAVLQSGSLLRDPYTGVGTRGIVQVGKGAALTVAGTTTLNQGVVLRLDDESDGTAAALTGDASTVPVVTGQGTLQWRSGTVAGPLTSDVSGEVTAPTPASSRRLSGAVVLSGQVGVDSALVGLLPGATVELRNQLSLAGTGAGLAPIGGQSGQQLTVTPSGALRRAAPPEGSTVGDAVVDVPVTNHGSLVVEAPLALRAGFSQVKATGPDPAAIPDPVTSLLTTAARLSTVDAAGAFQPLTLAAGGLGGVGTVATSKLTLGTTWLHPGFQTTTGTLRIEGDLQLGEASDVQIVMRDAGSKTQPKSSDALVVAPLVAGGTTRAAGRAILAGRLTGVSAGSYKPPYGTVVSGVIRFAARTGSFAKASSFGTPAGLGWRPRYDTSTKDGDGLGIDLRLSDVAPPALGLARVPLFTQRATQRVTYAAVDNRTGVATYDARWRRADPAAKAVGRWHRPKAWQRTTDTSQRLPGLRPGITTCFSVRVRDRAGNVSAWTQPLCTARLLDDAALRGTGGWSRASGRPGFYAGTVSRATKTGAELTRRGTFTRIGVTAVRCPGCGRLQVLVGTTVVKTLDLGGKRSRVLTWVSKLRKEQRATVRFRVVSSGKPVAIDSAGLLR